MLGERTSDCTKSDLEISSTHAAEGLVAKVEKKLRRLGIGSGSIVVAVSGGPDSVALMRALIDLQAKFGFDPLVMAHLNHQLRGEESDKDEAFVADLARAMLEIATGEVQVVCHQIDVKANALRIGDNLEKTAREERYSWLTQVAGQVGARCITTGHTANDQAETVLHRIIRGSGLKGLRGIAERRGLGKELDLIRPMLDVTRLEVMEYLQIKGQPFRQDSSNHDRRFTRNRIRQELLPLLEGEFNPAVVLNLCRLADQAAEEYGRVEEKAKRLLVEAELPRAGSLLILNRQRLSSAPRFLVREAFRLAWSREGWPMARIGFEEWDRLTRVAFGELQAVDMPGGIRAVVRPQVVQVGPHL
jgi:tRNA(Ile)-lysidine synthase